MTTLSDVKAQARLLQSYLRTKSADSLAEAKLSDCFETLAAIHNFKNWNTFRASLEQPSEPAAATAAILEGVEYGKVVYLADLYGGRGSVELAAQIAVNASLRGHPLVAYFSASHAKVVEGYWYQRYLIPRDDVARTSPYEYRGIPKAYSPENVLAPLVRRCVLVVHDLNEFVIAYGRKAVADYLAAAVGLGCAICIGENPGESRTAFGAESLSRVALRCHSTLSSDDAGFVISKPAEPPAAAAPVSAAIAGNGLTYAEQVKAAVTAQPNHVVLSAEAEPKHVEQALAQGITVTLVPPKGRAAL